MISVNSISKKIGDKSIYSSISLYCQEKCSYLLVGSNGVGKTSLLKSIIGLYIPDAGTVSIMGKKVTKEFKTPSNVGVFFDTAKMLPHNVVKKSLTFYTSLYNKKIIDIEPLIDLLHLKDEVNKKYINLSTGNKRKIALLISLINNPDIIIWDEPFASLDPEMCCELVKLIELLKSKGKTFLITTNDLYYGDRIYDKIGFFINSETIIEKNKDDLFNNYPEKSLNDIYFLIKSKWEK